MRTPWVPLLLLLTVAGCHSEPTSRRELRRTHYVLPPTPAQTVDYAPERRLALEAEWPAPYTVMRPLDEDVVRVRQNRWVQCDSYGQSFRLETSYNDGNVVRVRSGYYARQGEPCDRRTVYRDDRVVYRNGAYRNRAYGARGQPCQKRRVNYAAPVVVRVPQGRHRVGPPPVVIISR